METSLEPTNTIPKQEIWLQAASSADTGVNNSEASACVITNVVELQVKLEKCLKYAWTLHRTQWGRKTCWICAEKATDVFLKVVNAGLFLSQLKVVFVKDQVHGTFLTALSSIWHAYLVLAFKLRGSFLCSFLFSTQLCWASRQIKSPIGLWFLDSQPLVSFLAVFLNSCKHCVFLWLSDFLFVFSGTLLHCLSPLY